MVVRLQKVMADRGVASRRRAEEMITEGRVRVNGEVITTLGTRVPEDARIEIDGRLTAGPSARRYVLLNKPVGIVSTASDEHGRRTVVDRIGSHERLYPVGRLDTDSEGLLLLTNDGTWAERVLHPRYGHEREYDVAVEGDLTDEALARLQRGIPLEEGTARAVRVSVRSRSRGRSRFSLVLLTGWKRQVRRMCFAVGLKVTRLVRVRMGPLELGRLRIGEFRDLTKKEIDAMTSPTDRPVPRAREERARATAPGLREGKAWAIVSRRAITPATRPRARGRGGGWVAAPPRVTRRAGSSRARVQPGRPPIRSESSTRRGGAPRAPARRGSPARRDGVRRVERVSAPRRRAMDGRA